MQTTSAFLPLESHEQYEKAKKNLTLKEELPRLEGANMLLEKRNSSRRNEEAEPKQKNCPVVDVTGGESKV